MWLRHCLSQEVLITISLPLECSAIRVPIVPLLRVLSVLFIPSSPGKNIWMPIQANDCICVKSVIRAGLTLKACLWDWPWPGVWELYFWEGSAIHRSDKVNLLDLNCLYKQCGSCCIYLLSFSEFGILVCASWVSMRLPPIKTLGSESLVTLPDRQHFMFYPSLLLGKLSVSCVFIRRGLLEACVWCPLDFAPWAFFFASMIVLCVLSL